MTLSGEKPTGHGGLSPLSFVLRRELDLIPEIRADQVNLDENQLFGLLRTRCLDLHHQVSATAPLTAWVEKLDRELASLLSHVALDAGRSLISVKSTFSQYFTGGLQARCRFFACVCGVIPDAGLLTGVAVGFQHSSFDGIANYW